MLHFHLKLPAGALLAFLLASSAVQGASLPRYHSRFRGGGDTAAAAAYPPPSADMLKALEYIENLKQKNGAKAEAAPPPADYDEVDKIRVLLQLASMQDEGAADPRQSPPPPPPPPVQRQELPAEQLVKVLLKSLQDQVGRDARPAAAAPPAGSDRRAHSRHRTEETASPSAPRGGGDYVNLPRPHKKYPLMFEDEENRDAFRRATEDLDEQYTPQSLANLRSIFDELGRMPTTTTNGQKRDGFGDDGGDSDEEMFSLRNLAYEDVAGGEDWVPVEERMETEELVNGSHDEYDRDLTEGDLEGLEKEEMQRRASQDEEEADDDTKLVDYYLLKVLEMSDQSQKRGETGEQRKRLIRPSLVDPRTVKELLELSLKLHVPPQDLIDLLITDELRKLHRHGPQTSTTHFRTSGTGQTPKIRYYSRRLPVKSKVVAAAPEDLDREDFLDIIGVETISNEYPVRQRPLKPAASPARAPVVPSAPAANAVAAPAKIPYPAGRRENLFLSELNKMPLKRQADGGDDDDDDVEDEVTTYLAAKILTEYPQSSIAKRDTRQAQFPYELYEQAMKDLLDQADTGNKGKVAKRETESAPEEEAEAVEPTETHANNEMALKTPAPQTTADEEEKEQEHRAKQIAGM